MTYGHLQRDRSESREDYKIYTHAYFSFPTSIAGAWATHPHLTRNSFEARMGPQKGAHKSLTSTHCSLRSPRQGPVHGPVGLATSQQGWGYKGQSVGVGSPTEGFKEASSQTRGSSCGILNVLFPKSWNFPEAATGCLPLRDLSWYKRRIPFSWIQGLACNSRRT